MEYLYTAENLKVILGRHEHPKLDLTKCRVCKNLPDNISKVNIPSRNEFGSFPDEISQLVEFIIIKHSWQILACPLCGRLYTDKFDHEYLAGGGEDVYVIARIDFRDVLELLQGIKAKKLIQDGNRWLVMW